MNFAPQFDVFSTGLVKCFISHCGGSSTAESIMHGIPMVCLPFFGDQWEWALTVCKHHQAGVQINKMTSSASDIKQAVTEVITKPVYSERALAAAKRVREETAANMEHLGLELTSETPAGVHVAGAVIEAVISGKDPRAMMPAEKVQPGTSSCCSCKSRKRKDEPAPKPVV
eukprot:gnl/TRDRNA2_/TRDRNA2_87732_c0_seq1.p1 gnl/TRDRNA2_/TRDRNA2_87732_c0~~gnl/TRDRNA2_/TRDRNA2_87732_c0_seq1.p1  ORF type:complete len:171 (-),score=33.35 gnl/TRDRNA2_/TRDRNA2_87732_c0_seq1:43-555(-)